MPQLFLIFPAERPLPQPVCLSLSKMRDTLPVRITHRYADGALRMYFKFHTELPVQQLCPVQKTIFPANAAEGRQFFLTQPPVPENAFHGFFIPAFPGNAAKEHEEKKLKEMEGWKTPAAPLQACRTRPSHDKSARERYKAKITCSPCPGRPHREKSFYLPVSTYHTNRLLCFTYRLSSLAGSR